MKRYLSALKNLIGKWRADTVIATSAVLISVLALFVSVWEGYESRRHSRLSVRPHMVFGVSMCRDEICGVMIENAGLGPAIVKNVKVYFAGRLMEDKGINGWRSVAEVSTIFTDDRASFQALMPGMIIKPGQHIFLIKPDVEAIKDDTYYESFVSQLLLLKIDLECESFYGEKAGATFHGIHLRSSDVRNQPFPVRFQ